MKLLRMKLANWLTKGGYLAACNATTHWEEQHRQMQDKAVKLEQTLGATEQHLCSAERALIEKDAEIARLNKTQVGIQSTLSTVLSDNRLMGVTAEAVKHAMRDARAMTKGRAL